jgi:hypothetical protein
VKGKQLILLFIALLLPACIFIFLKMFGRNEFDVTPLFIAEAPSLPAHCAPVKAPYTLSETIRQQLPFGQSDLVLVAFDTHRPESKSQLQRVQENYGERVHFQTIRSEEEYYQQWRECIFLLQEPFDLVLVDRKGYIRGQYVSHNRDQVDRLLTEVAILLKQY